jgi:SAM-dependent methyltransferase
MLILLIALGFVILVFFGLLTFLLDTTFGGQDFITEKKVADKIVQIIKDRHLESGEFYDLGSCRGRFAVKIAKGLPNISVIGIDDSKFRTLFAKIRSVFLKNLKFRKENIFTANISSADIIYLYVPQELMGELQSKLQNQLKPGAIAISYSVSFTDWQPRQDFILNKEIPNPKKIFIYAKE